KEYAERWLRETIAPHRKEKTEDYYRQIIENHLAPALGPLALTEITPGRVRGLIAEKLSGQTCAKHDSATTDCETCVAPLSRNTVKNVAATLRAILYQAQQGDELTPNTPAARFGRLFNASHDAREHVKVLEP